MSEPVQHGIQQVKNNLSNSYIFTKYKVEDDEQSEARVIVKLWCMDIINESSELTKILRMIRKNIPKTHSVKTMLFFIM